MSDTTDPQDGTQQPPADDDDRPPQSVWLPDVVSLGAVGSGWDRMPGQSGWIGG